MKRVIALILISLLTAPSAWAGQKPGRPLDWEKVTRLKAGTEIMLSLSDSPPTKVKLLFADDSILVTLKPDAPKLPGRVERVLLMTGPHWPDILYRGGSITTDQVRVSTDGVFDGDRKVADLTLTRRGNVVGISQTQHSHLGWILLGVGAVIAAVLIYLAAIGYLED